MADASGADPIFEEAFKRLIRGDKTTLTGVLHSVHRGMLAKTQVDCHTYALTVDGNGRTQIKDLAQHLVHHVIDYAVPRRAVEQALAAQKKTGSASQLAKLIAEARALFVQSITAGEAGELLLSLLAETRLGLPQVLCKMDLKTSVKMHYHGADGIHIGWDQSGAKLRLYWGESKLHKNFNDAVKDCLTDLKKLLTADGGSYEAAARDLQLVARKIDLLDENLEKAVLNFFDADNPNYKQYEVCGIALVGFDDACYPEPPPPLKINQISDLVAAKLSTWQGNIGSRIEALSLEKFSIHFICVPFSSVDDFRAAMLKELGGVS